MTAKWRHFKFSEFTCQCGCGGNDIDAIFVTKLDGLRHALGFPFIITSGYRCPEHNNKVSNSGFTGAHTTGRAVDIRASNVEAFLIVSRAHEFGFTGIGVNQKGKSRFIHLDDLNEGRFFRPNIWSY